MHAFINWVAAIRAAGYASALMLVVIASSPANAQINSYKECYDPQRNRVVFACGAASCPTGTKYQRTVNQAIPQCNASPQCVDMKSLGWNNKGNKNKWCIAKGYAGVRPAPGE